MRLFNVKLQLPAGGGAGTGVSQSTSDMQDKWVQFSTVFAGSCNIEVSLDSGVTFFAVITGITGPTIVQLPQACTHARLRVVTFTSGVVTAWIAGYYGEG